jgi:hypothetical protein
MQNKPQKPHVLDTMTKQDWDKLEQSRLNKYLKERDDYDTTTNEQFFTSMHNVSPINFSVMN